MTRKPTYSACAAPILAVIIPHYDDFVRLRRCLNALMTQDLSGVEIVVADNATPGGLGELPAAYPELSFVIEPSKGAAAARNAGVLASTAPWIAFLDADCVPAPDWVDKVRAIVRGAGEVVTGGRIEVFDETPPPRSGAEAFENVFAFDQESYITRKGFSATANLVTTRTTFEAVGPFVVGVSEDLEWCQRATSVGCRLVYDPALCVGHPTRSDWPALRRKWLRLTTEGFALSERRRLGRIGWALRALAMPWSVLAHAPRILRHPKLSMSERSRAFVILVRLRLLRMGWMLGQAIGWSPR